MIRRISFYALPLVCSLLGSLNVAHATTITVTTFNDVSGNASVCSLRDAIKASATKTAVGGCAAGQQYYTDTIQLAAGTYTLTQGELVVNGNMNIQGDAASDPFSVDPLTGAEPARLPIATKIVAASGSRIFNTSVSLSPLNLSNIILSGGTANGASGGDSGFGGSILAGGTVYLSRVQINNATAAQQGGAIFIEGALSNLTATAVSFTGNNAPQGAVLGMSCFDNLIPTVRTFTLSQLSVTNNGSANTSTILDFCGQATTSITASTIAQNTTSSSAGSAISMVGNINTRLGRSSTLALVSNTITENHTPVALLYGISAGLSLTNNIVAFNDAVDCQYQGANDPNTGLIPVGTSAALNLFASTSNPATAATSKCSLHPASTTAKDTNIYADSSKQLSYYVSPLGLYGGSDLAGYLPVAGGPLIHKGDVVSSCGSNDQRGVARGSGIQNTNSQLLTINCDIGALELSILTANYDTGGANVSYTTVVNSTANTTGTTAAQAAQLIAQNKAYLDAYKSSYRYREVVMSVTSNDSAQENLTGSNTSAIDLLTDSTKYTITGSDSGNIHCEWNPVMKQLLASRNDGTVTPGGTIDSCNYTITEKANPSNTSTGTASFTVNSIAPTANSFTVTLPFGAASVPLDILSHANDDGNGPAGSTNYPTVTINGKVVPKPAFYSDNRIVNGVVTNIPANIIITKQPTQGHIVAQYQEPCANNNVNRTQYTCYGGTITYVNDNLYSPFNDSFTYQVLNYDLSPSNSGTVTVINTATTTDQTKAGGGSVGFGALLGLVSLVVLRRRLGQSVSSLK
ncbi:MAG: CSLREA domain-containing protein [Gammaproteobacteria bacterium]|nr:CSLREA domain-containing protein [Gammaproteobacteria bacterium]